MTTGNEATHSQAPGAATTGDEATRGTTTDPGSSGSDSSGLKESGPLDSGHRSTGFDSGRAWALDPQVALRPESFGALAYHFGTRRLSFLKSRTLLAVVEALDAQPSAAAACRLAGVSDTELPAYEHALATLATSGMIHERTAT